MKFKGAMKPLEGTNLLEDWELRRLEEASITTVEELIGVIEADAPAVSRLLSRPEDDMRRIRNQAEELLSPSAARRLREAPRRRHPLGALPPRKSDSG